MKVRLRQNLTIILVLMAIGSLYSLWVLDAVREARDEPRTAKTAATPAVGNSDVRLDAWVNDSNVVANGQLGFWLSIQNASPNQSVTGVKVIGFQRPGFAIPPQEVRSGCWTAGRPTCTTTKDPRTRFESLSLRAQEARAIEGTLVAGSQAGHYSISAVVEWSDAAGLTRRKPISVGPVFVQNAWKARALIAALSLQRFLKDLAFPIALALLAFFLKQIEQARADAKQRAADQLAANNKEAEERSFRAQQEAAKSAALTQQQAATHAALVQATWTLMLPKAHANAERYYMPLASNAQSVEEYYRTDEKELVFFYYLRFLGGMRQLNLKIGGFYLKNRDGEWLLSRLWDSVRSRGDKLFTHALRDEAQSVVSNRMTFGAFTKLQSPTIDKMRLMFLAPLNFEKLGVQIELLKLFRIILEYEMNDVYAPWYDVPERFPKALLDESFGRLKQYADTGELTNEEFETLDKRISSYLTSPRVQAQDVQPQRNEA